MGSDTATLRSLLTYTRDGEWGAGYPQDGFTKMRVIRGTDFERVRQGDLTTVPTRYIRTKIAARKTLRPWDILIETAGGSRDRPTGRTLLLHPGTLESVEAPLTCASFARFLRVDRNRVDASYVYWFLQCLYYDGEMERHQVQHTGVARFQFTNFADNLEIPLPPLPEQHSIAHVLGTLDDKIELNRRMSETLEAMARALFKSWFVDFDPVRAKMEGRWHRGESLPGLPAEHYDLFSDRLVYSELGEVPDGWEVKTLGEVSNVSSGKRPGRRFPVPNDEAKIPLWGANGPMAFVAEPLADFPILLTGRVGTLGSVFRITTPCWPSDNTLIVTANSGQFFNCLFFHMERVDFGSLNRGSTQPLLTQSDLKPQLVIMPPEYVLEHFDYLTARLLDNGDRRQQESHNLAAQRDALLPRLVSGEVGVGGMI